MKALLFGSVTDLDAPKGKVIAIDITRPDKANLANPDS